MLTQARLKELLHYDPETGIFTWIVARSGHLAGAVAGSKTQHGYIRITVEYKEQLAHRLAWLYMTGEFPNGKVDHKNTVGTDNRWGNLRLATTQQNAFNQAMKAGNKAGYKGVCKSSSKKWKASIKVSGKSEHIGTFSSPELAAEAYRVRAAQVQGEFIHPSIS